MSDRMEIQDVLVRYCNRPARLGGLPVGLHGLISGTSFDAVEAVAADLELQGATLHCRLLGSAGEPYPPEVRDALAATLPPAPASLHDVCRLDTLIGQAFAAVAEDLARTACEGRAELVCSHGQTVYHRVEDGRTLGTLQLGQPAWIAEWTGLPVVSDVRGRDVAAGGQGAPLVSVLDVLLLGSLDGPAAALNLGGIANLTFVEPGRDPVAYDTGPGNALIDAAVRELSGGTEHLDEDGRRAARGRVDARLLERLLDDPFYRSPPPKTTGKERFHATYLGERLGEGSPDPDDPVATVTALTVETVGRELERLGARDVYVSGGGTRNPTLMAGLRDRVPGARLLPSDDLGVPERSKEALAFAVIAFLTAHGLPANVPSCTGGAGASGAGSVTPGRAPLRLPEPAPVAPRSVAVR
jgi:anhydro-N-acetylmuramic acid kinase